MIDPRVDRLEREVEGVQSQINNLHSGSMQLVTTAFTEMERRLGDKIDRQAGNLETRLDKLRGAMVPLSEHQILMQRMEVLWNRDLQGREIWDRMVPQVGTLWDERSQVKGALRFWRAAAFMLGAVFTLLSLFVLLRSAHIL